MSIVQYSGITGQWYIREVQLKYRLDIIDWWWYQFEELWWFRNGGCYVI